jgi:hypothetical protein
VRVVVSSYSFGLMLLAVGIWLLLKSALGLGWYFTAGTLAVLALVAWCYYLVKKEMGYVVAGWLLVAWAAYAALDGLLLGQLPGSAWLVFLGIGFLVVYGLHTRPGRWPLIPASILLGLGTFFWVVGTALRWTFALAPYLLPALLVAWGVWLLVGWRRKKDAGGWVK